MYGYSGMAGRDFAAKNREHINKTMLYAPILSSLGAKEESVPL